MAKLTWQEVKKRSKIPFEEKIVESNSNLKEKIISKLKSFFKDNHSRYSVNIIFLYGSWSGGYPHKESDIDLAILFSDKVSTEECIFSLITDISYELEKILNKEVSIISICRDFRKPMLYYNAIVSGIPVFIKDKEMFIDLKIEAISQMEDFSLFGIPWQLEIAKKVIGERYA